MWKQLSSGPGGDSYYFFYIFFCRYTLLGINLGFCERRGLEMHTSIKNGEVLRWIKKVSIPFHESSICATVSEESSPEVREQIFYIRYSKKKNYPIQTCLNLLRLQKLLYLGAYRRFQKIHNVLQSKKLIYSRLRNLGK